MPGQSILLVSFRENENSCLLHERSIHRREKKNNTQYKCPVVLKTNPSAAGAAAATRCWHKTVWLRRNFIIYRNQGGWGRDRSRTMVGMTKIYHN